MALGSKFGEYDNDRAPSCLCEKKMGGHLCSALMYDTIAGGQGVEEERGGGGKGREGSSGEGESYDPLHAQGIVAQNIEGFSRHADAGRRFFCCINTIGLKHNLPSLT